jgi:hypothetical protein
MEIRDAELVLQMSGDGASMVPAHKRLSSEA